RAWRVGMGGLGRVDPGTDDADGDLTLPLAQRVAGAEVRPERPHHVGQLPVVDIDLIRAGQPAAGLHQPLIRVLLLGSHLVVRDLGVASERRRRGHWLSPLRKPADGQAYPVARPRAIATPWA